MNLNFSQLAGRLSPKGWLAVGGATLATVAFLFLLVNLASAPSYTTLLAGINPTQTGKITSALSTAGINYELQNNGTAIAVETSQQAQAHVTLASAGLLSGTGSGSSLSSLEGNSSLTESDSQQEIQYQSALEQQLDQTIENMSGINSAQVQLVLPNPQTELFSSSATPSSAAVLLNDNDDVSSSTAKAIADLVASSVPSLQNDKVTITDQNGSLLWPTSSSTDGDSSLLAKQQAEQQYDEQMSDQIDAMLAGTLGAGKAQVQVNANLNTDQTTLDSVQYADKGTPLTTTTSKETLTGSGAASAAAGTSATSISTYASGSGKNSNQQYSNSSGATQYGVDKTISHTVVSPGQITSQSVSVLLSKSVPASDVATIQSAVENAVGYNAKRGDTISVGQLAFAKTTPVAASSTTKMFGDVKYVVLGIGALLFLLFTTRALRRRESEPFSGTPTWLSELDDPRPLSAIEAELEAPTRVMALAPPGGNAARRQVEDLADRAPDRVANQVRAWMGED